VNSHDKSSAYQLHCGLFRLVCTNRKQTCPCLIIISVPLNTYLRQTAPRSLTPSVALSAPARNPFPFQAPIDPPDAIFILQ
jgi:hypothetical protein